MTDDIEERAALARRGIMDHSDCEECTEDWTFLMRQGRREFPLGLRTVLACLAFAEREGAVPPDVYLEVQHPCWSCNSNSSSANASAGVR